MDTFTDSRPTESFGNLTDDVGKQRSKILTDDLHYLIMFINMGIICQTISVFGVVSNIINIIIFIKQGFTDCVNISLISLAVSDLMSLLFLMWSNLCFTPVFRESAFPLVTDEIQIISGGWPHVGFTRTTGWITMFISLERCICVIIPLKVKTLFTWRRHIFAMVTIFVGTLGLSSLGYVVLGIGRKFYPGRNATLIGLVYRIDGSAKRVANYINYTIVGVLMPMACFLSVVFLTLTLVVKLNQQAAWRILSSSFGKETPNTSNRSTSLSTRDQKVAKMIVLISCIFIICFVPALGIFISSCFEPELSYDGFYKNIFLVIIYTSFTAEVINSSINIFIYYRMSSKYRNTFYTIMKCFKF